MRAQISIGRYVFRAIPTNIARRGGTTSNSPIRHDGPQRGLIAPGHARDVGSTQAMGPPALLFECMAANHHSRSVKKYRNASSADGSKLEAQYRDECKACLRLSFVFCWPNNCPSRHCSITSRQLHQQRIWRNLTPVEMVVAVRQCKEPLMQLSFSLRQ
jgi:hypothetical protein